MYWNDGSIYKGDWVEGVQHGIGSLTLKGGKVKKGKFENNMYVGKIYDEKERESLQTPLEPLKEDPEEEMRVSRTGPF